MNCDDDARTAHADTINPTEHIVFYSFGSQSEIILVSFAKYNLKETTCEF